MTQIERKGRILFIDLMRALAVVMMIQGHTVDVLLSDQYRNSGHPFLAVYGTIRGLTAPIFLFSSGTVFIYLFRMAGKPFRENPRVAKGVRRVLLLLSLGYLLRYPTAQVADFTYVTAESWKIFFAVDVLHLIGASLLILLLLALLAEKSKLSDAQVFLTGALFFFAAHPLFQRVNWTEFLPVPIANYLYTGNGSPFPLFPNAGYVMCGGVLGAYLANRQFLANPKKLSLLLAAWGAGLFALYPILHQAGVWLGASEEFQTLDPGLVLMRLGLVLLINALVSFIAFRINSVPNLIILAGRSTLLIYVVHVVILYGSAWNGGLGHIFQRSFSLCQTVVAVLLMIAAMAGLAVLYDRGSTLFKESFSLLSRYN